MKFDYKEQKKQHRAIKEELKAPQRITSSRVMRMMEFLKKRGFAMRVWVRFDKPQYRIKINQWEYFARTYKEAWSFLLPFYREQLEQEYSEMIQASLERKSNAKA